MSEELVKKIEQQGRRIENLNAKKSELSGKLGQLKTQQGEQIEALKREFGIDSVEGAEAEIVHMREQIQRDLTTVDDLLGKAEAILSAPPGGIR
jgi:TolA-binding protein